MAFIEPPPIWKFQMHPTVSLRHSILVPSFRRIFVQTNLFLKQVASGRVADWVRSSGRLTTLATRRVFNSVGFGIQAAALIAVAICVHKMKVALVLLIAATALGEINTSGKWCPKTLDRITIH